MSRVKFGTQRLAPFSLLTHSLIPVLSLLGLKAPSLPISFLHEAFFVVKMLQEMCKPKQIRRPSQLPVAWAENMCLREDHLPWVSSNLIPSLQVEEIICKG